MIKIEYFHYQAVAGEFLRDENGTAGVEFSSVVIALYTQEEIA
jgi:Flp pilus assembly protein TadG